ncbi:MAG: hypothetical protein HUK08_08150, partial [Bacteroidaceae bacterium]|nr:hypothetical protein [Bacteroidaceae bacterium]
YSKEFKSIIDEGYVPLPTEGSDDKLITKFTGWDETKNFLISAGVMFSKDFKQFHVSLGADAYYMTKHLFFSVNAKGQYFPVEGNLSHVYVLGGFGTAPEATLIDNSMPGTFDHMNTHVGLGGLYFINRYLTAGISGTWYTLYDINEVLLNPGVHYAQPKTVFETEKQTKYTNYFYLHAHLFITF